MQFFYLHTSKQYLLEQADHSFLLSHYQLFSGFHWLQLSHKGVQFELAGHLRDFRYNEQSVVYLNRQTV